MIQADLSYSFRTGRLFLGLALALTLTRHATDAKAQIIAIGPPSFQSNDFPSLETTILDRLALGGQYDPGDLSTLAHLTVLESIAMFADIQADMPDAALGPRLQAEVRQLWDAGAAFEETSAAGPINMSALTRLQPLYNNIRSAYGDIEATLGGSVGLTGRAAEHFRDITRLTAAISSMMRAFEADALASAPVRVDRTADVDRLKKHASTLASEIVALMANIKKSKHEGSKWDAVTKDLEHLLSLEQAFEKTLSSQPTDNDVKASLHAIRRRTWQVEARIARLGWPVDLERQWRGLRLGINLLSDELGLPRVIDLAARDQQRELPKNSGAPPKPTARIYRGPQ